MRPKPHYKKKPKPFGALRAGFFEPVKVLFAVLTVALFFFAPVTSPSEEETTPELIEAIPALDPFAFNAGACPWDCIKCTEWDPDAWPKTCLTFECVDASGKCGDPGDGGGGPVNQPPTISHVLTCSNPGNNDWCIGTLSLDLTASDPQGQTVIISGDVNPSTGSGEVTTFAYPSGQTTCSIPLSEGTGTVNYKVDSATSLYATGSTSYQLDTTTPQINGNINGSSGTNSWYISQTSVTALAFDSLSGIASFEVNMDNTGYVSYSDTTFTDGMHTIQFRAMDNAGNVTETAVQSINVDTVAPTLNVSTTGTTGSNGWYVSVVTLAPTVSDATSGLYSLEATTDGVTWISVSTPITLTDGIYTVQFRATDQAGNVSQTAAQQIKVDATTPSVSLNTNGTRGQNDWYISSVIVASNASDAGSGINKIEASVNDSPWSAIISPLSFTDGVHSYKVRATDNAGNVTETPFMPMMVDTVPPAIAISDDTLDLGDTLIYDLEDTMSGLWINRSVIEDEDEKYKKIVWLEELTGNKSNDNEIRWDGVFADGTKAAPGQYFITLKISDQAGNETMRSAIVEVTAFNSLLPIPAFIPPVGTVTEPIPSGSSTTDKQSFGGANNGNVGTETTTTNGETVFASVNLQAGGTSSFTTGNQTTSTPISNPNILWGAAAAAMLGATLAEWQKKREEDAARLAALIASNAGQGDQDEMPADVLARRRGKVIAKNEAKRAQERVWEAAKIQQQAQQQAKIAKAKVADVTEDERFKLYQTEQREEALQAQRAGEWNAEQIVENYEARAHELAMQAYHAGERNAVQIARDYKVRASEQATQAYHFGEWNAVYVAEEYRVNKNNWWKSTKEFVSKYIVQPFNATVYQPYIQPEIEREVEWAKSIFSWGNENIYKPFVQPELERRIEKLKSEINWVDEHIYQPYIQPELERRIEKLESEIAWINEHIYQPYIQPELERRIESIKSDFAWINENIYQPVIKPIADSINKQFYEPHIKPVVDKILQVIETATSWANLNIYLPIFEPVVSDIKKYIFKPLDKAWDKYGEWVHGSLDAAGFVPGFGEIADGLNGLIYLGEGRYIEASVSAVAMLPILGDLGKAGKWTVKAGQELLEETGEMIAKETAEEVLEVVAKETTPEVVEVIVEKTMRESGEDIAKTITENFAEEAVKETAEKTIKETGEELTNSVLAESVENTAKNAIQTTAGNILEKTVKDTGGVVTSVSTEEVKEKLFKQALGKVNDKTAVLVNSVVERINDFIASINKTIILVQKYGLDAVKALIAAGPKATAKVLKTVDENILDDVVRQGSDAFAAFSSWTENELQGHAKDLAARASRDAEVLNDVKTLVSKGPIDPKNLTNEQKLLIEKIAANSTFIVDGKQIVVGKWAGLDGGFLARARETGSLHYGPHPDLWGLFNGLENQNEVAWLINKQVIQTGIASGLPFEYTLNGILAKDIGNERAAIKAIFSGQTEAIIKRKLKSDYLPVRLRELQELKNAGFDITFDEMNNSYILIKP